MCSLGLRLVLINVRGRLGGLQFLELELDALTLGRPFQFHPVFVPVFGGDVDDDLVVFWWSANFRIDPEILFFLEADAAEGLPQDADEPVILMFVFPRSLLVLFDAHNNQCVGFLVFCKILSNQPTWALSLESCYIIYI